MDSGGWHGAGRVRGILRTCSRRCMVRFPQARFHPPRTRKLRRPNRKPGKPADLARKLLRAISTGGEVGVEEAE